MARVGLGVEDRRRRRAKIRNEQIPPLKRLMMAMPLVAERARARVPAEVASVDMTVRYVSDAPPRMRGCLSLGVVVNWSKPRRGPEREEARRERLSTRCQAAAGHAVTSFRG
jgi:hypothetical protein